MTLINSVLENAGSGWDIIVVNHFGASPRIKLEKGSSFKNSGYRVVRFNDSLIIADVPHIDIYHNSFLGTDSIRGAVTVPYRLNSPEASFGVHSGLAGSLATYTHLGILKLTTTQRDALTPINGNFIYNITLNKFQGYENGAWANMI